MQRRSLARSIGSLIGIGGLALCITLLSQSMRAVEAVGGSCASGGPYAISRPCPNGVAGTFPLAIFGGLIFLGLFVFCASDKGRTVALLAWSALFLTLAWNFIDYGTKSGSTGGVGFLIPGILFIVMGAAPLFWVVPSMIRAFLGTDDEDSPKTQMGPFVAASGSGMATMANTAGSTGWGTGTGTSSWPTSAPVFSTPTAAPTSTSARVTPAPTSTTTSAAGGDLATELERLASLHRRGELSDAEYESAKQQALSKGGTA